MQKDIRQKLIKLAEPDFKDFSNALIPNVNNMLGVRIPLLRGLAKELTKDDDFREYLKPSEDEYFEEVLLKGLIIAYAKMEAKERLKYIGMFVPKINNWAICDTFCNSLKFTTKNMELVWQFLEPYAKSDKEYYLRFASIMYLSFYLNDDYIDRIFAIFDDMKIDEYYVQMGVAWCIATAYVKCPAQTEKYLNNNKLDDFTYNKSLQKIIESLRVDKETKDAIRKMKRK